MLLPPVSSTLPSDELTFVADFDLREDAAYYPTRRELEELGMPASVISHAVKRGDSSPDAPVPNLSSFYKAALEWALYSIDKEPWMWEASKNERVDAVMDMLQHMVRSSTP